VDRHVRKPQKCLTEAHALESNLAKPDGVFSKTIPLFSAEAKIKRQLRRHLKLLGFTKDKAGLLHPPDFTKETIRSLHSAQRNTLLKEKRGFIGKNWTRLSDYFASGKDVRPQAVLPKLELVQSHTWQSDLFRLASLTWSIPVSQGYGRRMRFLVWDETNEKLIGLLALGDPVFNLSARDEWIGWTLKQKESLLVNIMDAYVLGAVPPYNLLLGGKMIAALIRTREILNYFIERYTNSTGIISKKNKLAQLCLVTTTSALGRSSVYNRLQLNGTKILEPIGYTSGWGHFHIPDELFASIRLYLEERGDSYAGNHKFGDGPNWRLRAIRKALRMVGVDPDLLRHGISRQVFVCGLASNARVVLTERATQADHSGLPSVSDVGLWAREKWILPRSKRKPEYAAWEKADMIKLLNSVTDSTVAGSHSVAKSQENLGDGACSAQS
jgi:hypothetical protein